MKDKYNDDDFDLGPTPKWVPWGAAIFCGLTAFLIVLVYIATHA